MTASALLLAPGAGADRNQRTLVALERGLAPMPVRRFDFPYRLAGRRAPDKPEVAVAAVVEAATGCVSELGIDADHLVLGGRSFGGRMCSMAVAAGLPAAGLVLLSYPLHPPGRRESLRVEHFPDIRVPVLFVGGSADPFGSPAEFTQQVSAISGPVQQVWLPGGHDPRPAQDVVIIDAVQRWLSTL